MLTTAAAVGYVSSLITALLLLLKFIRQLLFQVPQVMLYTKCLSACWTAELKVFTFLWWQLLLRGKERTNICNDNQECSSALRKYDVCSANHLAAWFRPEKQLVSPTASA